jgi:hypothetical protein
MAVITLDRDALELARAIVDRERPTPQQEARFDWTARLVLTTFVLVMVWVATAINAPSYQRAFLFAAALTCLISIALFAFNAGFVSRLWRTFWTAKRLGVYRQPAKRTLAQRAWSACLWIILLLGIPLLVIGISGIGVAMERGDSVELLVALSLVIFALGCLLLLPMELVRRRVNAMRALRGALDSGRPAAEGEVAVPVRAYDRITDLQFARTVIDSHESLANDTGPDADAGPAVRFRHGFQEAVANLPGRESDLVYDVIGDLHGSSDLADTVPGGEMLLPVPGTTFHIRLRRHPQRNEIEVVALETVSAPGRSSSHG